MGPTGQYWRLAGVYGRYWHLLALTGRYGWEMGGDCTGQYWCQAYSGGPKLQNLATAKNMYRLPKCGRGVLSPFAIIILASSHVWQPPDFGQVAKNLWVAKNVLYFELLYGWFGFA